MPLTNSNFFRVQIETVSVVADGALDVSYNIWNWWRKKWKRWKEGKIY